MRVSCRPVNGVTAGPARQLIVMMSWGVPLGAQAPAADPLFSMAGVGSGVVFSDVLERVGDDVGDVVVGEGVFDGAGAAVADHEPGGAEHPQVLGHQRLGDAQGGDQFVDLPAAVDELPYDAEPDG